MIEPTAETALGIVSAGGISLYLINLFIRLFSRGKLDVNRDRAEVDIIKTLQEENRLLREQARLAYQARDVYRNELADLKMVMALLKRDLKDSEDRLVSLREKINQLERRDAAGPGGPR
jgi:septal ring factor EnvC (AmiA/AmiB activator)